MNRASQVVFKESNELREAERQYKDNVYRYISLIVSIFMLLLAVANFFAVFPLVVKIIKKSNTWFRDILMYFFANPFFALKYINKSK